MLKEVAIHAAFFFRDPLDRHQHKPDNAMRMWICEVHNVSLATKPANAELRIKEFQQP